MVDIKALKNKAALGDETGAALENYEHTFILPRRQRLRDPVGGFRKIRQRAPRMRGSLQGSYR